LGTVNVRAYGYLRNAFSIKAARNERFFIRPSDASEMLAIDADRINQKAFSGPPYLRSVFRE
jgi:hypothetical protein